MDKDLPGLELIDPAVELDPAVPSRSATQGDLAEVVELDQDVLADRRVEQGLAFEVAVFAADIRRGSAPACASQLATVGNSFSESGLSSAFIAPHWECPQTTMWATFRATTAYSMTAVASVSAPPWSGTMLPRLRS